MSHPQPTTTTTTTTTTRTGSGQTGARNCKFLVQGLLAGAPELALARLGPEMAMFLSAGLLARAPELALAKLGPEMAGRPLMMPRRGRLSPSIVKESHRRCNENVFLGHVCVHFRGLRRLGNTSHTIGAKSGTKMAHKRWAPTVGAHTLLYNLVPFSELIIRAQQRDPIGT